MFHLGICISPTGKYFRRSWNVFALALALISYALIKELVNFSPELSPAKRNEKLKRLLVEISPDM